jgi:hypothetical protein
MGGVMKREQGFVMAMTMIILTLLMMAVSATSNLMTSEARQVVKGGEYAIQPILNSAQAAPVHSDVITRWLSGGRGCSGLVDPEVSCSISADQMTVALEKVTITYRHYIAPMVDLGEGPVKDGNDELELISWEVSR